MAIVLLHDGAGHGRDAELLAGAAQALPLRKSCRLVGGLMMSKLRSLSTMLPIKPVLELTPTPKIRLPVLASLTSISMSLNSASPSRSSTLTSGPAAAVLTAGENAHAHQVGLGDVQVGISENLAGKQRHLAENDVVAGAFVSDDENLADARRADVR